MYSTYSLNVCLSFSDSSYGFRFSLFHSAPRHNQRKLSAMYEKDTFQYLSLAGRNQVFVDINPVFHSVERSVRSSSEDLWSEPGDFTAFEGHVKCHSSFFGASFGLDS